MARYGWLLPAALISVLFGCASTDETAPGPPTPPHPAFAQIKASPDTYRGQPVSLGGQVLAARRLKDGTRIEILHLPLASSQQPVPDLRKSEGRFVAMQREFLDPATVPAGTLVTVTGELSGSVVLPLDDTDYTYPVVEIRNLRVWEPQAERPMRVRPYMGPGPYWGPYWSPYWRPYPYW